MLWSRRAPCGLRSSTSRARRNARLADDRLRSAVPRLRLARSCSSFTVSKASQPPAHGPRRIIQRLGWQNQEPLPIDLPQRNAQSCFLNAHQRLTGLLDVDVHGCQGVELALDAHRKPVLRCPALTADTERKAQPDHERTGRRARQQGARPSGRRHHFGFDRMLRFDGDGAQRRRTVSEALSGMFLRRLR